MKLADKIAVMHEQGVFLLEVATSGDEQAIERLVAALKDLDKGERCMAPLDAHAVADARDDEARAAAARLWRAVYATAV